MTTTCSITAVASVRTGTVYAAVFPILRDDLAISLSLLIRLAESPDVGLRRDS